MYMSMLYLQGCHIDKFSRLIVIYNNVYFFNWYFEPEVSNDEQSKSDSSFMSVQLC